MPRRQLTGQVTSDKMAKTRVVTVARLEKHPRYGKYVRRRTVCYVHDERNESREGDTVEIVECPPRSKQKRWELLRVVAQGGAAGPAPDAFTPPEALGEAPAAAAPESAG